MYTYIYIYIYNLYQIYMNTCINIYTHLLSPLQVHLLPTTPSHYLQCAVQCVVHMCCGTRVLYSFVPSAVTVLLHSVVTKHMCYYS